MRKEIIQTGKTVEDALETAFMKLGVDRDKVESDWKIIDLPKTSFFGLKKIPAKVKLTVELPEPKQSAGARPQERRAEQKPRQEQQRKAAPPQQQKRERPVNSPSPAPQKAAAKPAPSQATPASPASSETVAKKQDYKVQEKTINPEKIDAAKEYISGILSAMGLEGELTVATEPDGFIVSIEGQGLGAIIGRRGETLDALQYLTSLVANRLEGDYLRITVDCGEYRKDRQQALVELAKRAADQVLKTNVSKTLEPMNPSERRIIHATVSEIEGVSSASIGVEAGRRVVIKTPTSTMPSRSRDDRGGSGRDRDHHRDSRRDGGRPRSGGGGRGNRDRDRDGRRDSGPRREREERKPASALPIAPAQPPKPTPETSSDTPLYGKIEL
ncbi:MAG: RNA-binding cell elongation regulator Jag/EloR [Oscillospiraceae bacterium]